MTIIKKIFISVGRILLLLSIVTSIGLIIYLIWSPGNKVTDGRNDLSKNAIWIQHGWLASDDWLTRNDKDFEKFRSKENIQKLLQQLKSSGFKYIYPHACPCDHKGNISPVNHMQVERFPNSSTDLDLKVIPWIGGVYELQCEPESKVWRDTFVASAIALIEKHPRLSGFHINIEPMPSGNSAFLLLLEELKAELPEGKILSVAAYPPPTRWQPSELVHWDENYFKEVAKRVDQLVPMMYDTSIPLEKPYISLMKDWTNEILAWSEGKEVLLGIPAYEDVDVGYHNPKVEHISSSLRGINAALDDQSELPDNYAGIAVYSEWEMDDEKWRIIEAEFMKKQHK